MSLYSKNIWKVFYLILAIWVLLFASLAYKAHEKNLEEVLAEQRGLTKLTVSSITSLFRQHEIILDVLTNQLSQTQRFPTMEEAYKALENVIDVDDTLIDIAIVRKNGQFFASPAQGGIKIGIMNMMTTPQTQESFQRTLTSDHAVVGRTYYNEALNELIIPVRKAARDKEGNILFVLSAVVKVETGFSFLFEQERNWELYDSFIYREEDRYFQLAPIRFRYNNAIYNQQVSKQDVSSAIESFENSVGITVDEIKQNKLMAVNQEIKKYGDTISTSAYIDRYKLWLTIDLPKKHINLMTIKDVIILFGILFFALSIIYLLFRKLDSNERQKFDELTKQANQDYLTKLRNRYFLDQNYSKLSYESPFTLLYVDLDNFKVINDTFGHEIGDKVLKEVANRLKHLISSNDTLIRYSGDEFIIILNTKNPQTANKLASDVLFNMREPIYINDQSFRLTTSIGAAIYPEHGVDLEQIKRNADIALHESKKSKNKFTHYSSSLDKKHLYLAKVEHELTKALDNGELSLAYQPQVDNAGHILGVEALVRWHNPELGNIGPDVFIPVAERSGKIIEIGKFIYQKAISDISDITNQTQTPLQLSINFSGVQLQNKQALNDAMDTFKSCMQSSTINLVIEITESVFVENHLGVLSWLSAIKEAGCKVSLDDFGTGYSSLSMLEKLPLDELKLDKSFVDNMSGNQRGLLMVEGIINLAKQLQLSIVAEGVETEVQHRCLVDLGCDIYQGYLFSKPLRKQQLLELINPSETSDQ